MRAKIITSIRKYLVDENIYTPKDEITLILLEVTYSEYQKAMKEVKRSGQTLQQIDSNGKVRTVINAAFKNQIVLQKELFKIIDSLYLSPKSRKTKKEFTDEKDNPFSELIKDMNNIEKR